VSVLALDEHRWLTPCPCRFKPRNDLVPIVCEAGWAPGAGWKSAEKLAYTGIQSLDLPALARSLYILRYLAQKL